MLKEQKRITAEISNLFVCVELKIEKERQAQLNHNSLYIAM